MTKKTIIAISESAQEQVKKAIAWRSRSTDESEARDHIKGVIQDWQNQMSVAPESGKPTKHTDSEKIRECIKGGYRLVYEVAELDDCFNIVLLIFCSTRQDYQTLLKLR